MKNKAIILISARSDIGGGPTQMYELAKALSHQNEYKVIIAAPMDPPYGQLFQNLAHRFISLPPRRFSFFAFLKLLFLCFQHPTLVHSHGRGAGIYSRLLHIFGVKVIHTFHGIHALAGIKNKIKLFIDKLLGPLTDVFLFVSEDEKQKAIQFGLIGKEDARGYIISNAINEENLHKNLNQFNKQNLREEFGVRPNDIVLGTLARLDYEKGLDLMIKSFSHLDSNYKLFIAGDGPEKDKLLKLTQSLNLNQRVYFLGPIAGPAKLLALSDIYISFSYGEGLPLSVLEAICAKVPCLVSKVPGHIELGKKEMVITFDLQNKQSFLEGLNHILKNQTALKENAYLMLQKYYSLEQMIKEHTKIYQKI